ncbi:MAG: sugar kinase [Kiritimatiellae bacterium]|nr:sugar kinase [Kiritimatiellia bacterium]
MKKDKLIIVGSVGIDTIETPSERHESILGGSASYACAAASFFTDVGMVGVVGTDFPEAYRDVYRHFKIDVEGLQTAEGETFRWSGVYEDNMDHRRTLSTDLNIFASFAPELPASYQQSPYLFLANISPDLQLYVLDQMEELDFVVADTMDLWIDTARETLKQVIGRVDMLTLNESEAKHLTEKNSLIQAGQELLNQGPQYILIKKGEHGSLLLSQEGIFLIPAYPIEVVQDPTGAGDSYAGGLMGMIASEGNDHQTAIRRAILYGSVVASFGVEQFSLDALQQITLEDIQDRAKHFWRMIEIDD